MYVAFETSVLTIKLSQISLPTHVYLSLRLLFFLTGNHSLTTTQANYTTHLYTATITQPLAISAHAYMIATLPTPINT